MGDQVRHFRTHWRGFVSRFIADVQYGESGSLAIRVELRINGKTVKMEAGAVVSIISNNSQPSLFPDATVHKSGSVLRTYIGEGMAMFGEGWKSTMVSSTFRTYTDQSGRRPVPPWAELARSCKITGIK